MSIDTAIDSMITEANPEGNKPPAAPETKPAEQTTAQPQNENGKKPEESEVKDPNAYKTPWPKTAIDVMNRKDKKIEAARKELEELRKQLADAKYLKQKLQELEPAPATDQNDPAPDISKYQDWVKYNQDLTAWNVRQLQKQQAQPAKPVDKPVDPQKAAWQQQRLSHVTNKTRELLEAHPEYLPVFQQNQDLLDDLPQETKDILLATDNAALAVLQMAQDGTLGDLPYMGAPLAQRTIMDALGRAAALVTANGTQVSQAPAPIKTSKNVKTAEKDASKMTDDEFRKAFL